MENNQRKGRSKVLLYFMTIHSILKEDGFHILWFLFVLFFAYLSIFISFLMEGASVCFSRIRETGDLLIISVGVLAPCLFDILVSIVKERKYKETLHFVSIKIIIVVVGFILCVFTPFFAIGYYRTNVFF